MTKIETDHIDTAIYSLATVTDTANGAVREQLIGIIQQLSDLAGARTNVRVWLHEFNPSIPVEAPTAVADAAAQEFDETMAGK